MKIRNTGSIAFPVLFLLLIAAMPLQADEQEPVAHKCDLERAYTIDQGGRHMVEGAELQVIVKADSWSASGAGIVASGEAANSDDCKAMFLGGKAMVIADHHAICEHAVVITGNSDRKEIELFFVGLDETCHTGHGHPEGMGLKKILNHNGRAHGND